MSDADRPRGPSQPTLSGPAGDGGASVGEQGRVFNNQATFVPDEPVLLSKGEVRRVEGGSVWNPSDDAEAAEFSHGRDESIVMSNHRYVIDKARCV
jgi:hypothetical protein